MVFLDRSQINDIPQTKLSFFLPCLMITIKYMHCVEKYFKWKFWNIKFHFIDKIMKIDLQLIETIAMVTWNMYCKHVSVMRVTEIKLSRIHQWVSFHYRFEMIMRSVSFLYDNVMLLPIWRDCPFVFITGFTEGSNLSDLVDNLFQGYHKDIRPVCDLDSPVQVRLGIAVRQIINLVNINTNKSIIYHLYMHYNQH